MTALKRTFYEGVHFDIGNKLFTITYILSLLLISLASLILPLDSASAATEAIAKFSKTEGKVDVLKGGALPAVSAKNGDTVFLKDIVRTKSSSQAEVIFTDGTVLRIGQRSRIDISEYATKDKTGKTIINLPRGKVEALVPPSTSKQIADSKSKRFEIHTPNAVAGVRGTNYIVYIENDITWVLVKEGSVTIYNPAFPDQVIIVNAGELASVLPDKAPVKKEASNPEIQRIELAGKIEETGFEGTENFNSDSVVITPVPLTPPVVEIGRTTLSGSLVAGPSGQFDFISVIMKDVIFFAPSNGQAPTIWTTGSISGDYSFGPNISNGVSSIPVSDGRGITGNFNITQWGNNNTWSGNANGQGNLSGGSYSGPVSFQGNVGGTHTGGNSGTFAGTGSGTASK
jgi:hypothetical protein